MRFKLHILAAFIWLRLGKQMFWYAPQLVRRYRKARLQKKLMNSGYYSNLLNTGVSMSEMPIMNKKIFMENFDTINTCGISLQEARTLAIAAETSRDFRPTFKGITVGLSSGTGGNKGIFLASESERAWWAGCVLERIAGWSFQKRKVAFFLRANSNLYSSVGSNLLSFHFFDLWDPVGQNLRKLNDLNPDILVAQPSMLLQIVTAMDMRKVKIRPKRIISVAEVLSQDDRHYLQEKFGQVIHEVYQCTEGLLACSCRFGRLHFNEDFLLIEKQYIDDERKRFHPVITDLMRSSQPVVRYQLDDIVTEHAGCPCGSPFMAIEQIEGRWDDMLCFLNHRGAEVKIFPDFFRRAIVQCSEAAREYILLQKTSTHLDLYLGGGVSEVIFEKAVKCIQEMLAHFEVSGVSISRLPVSPHQTGKKLRRIQNDLQQTNQRYGLRQIPAQDGQL
jgi:putative adenylate-forming enzyme